LIQLCPQLERGTGRWIQDLHTKPGGLAGDENRKVFHEYIRLTVAVEVG
jgi:hypothetical protein